MIISKPKVGTLFSIAVFILICLAGAAYTTYTMLHATEIAWYQYVLVVILFPIGVGLLAKMVFGYKVIEIGKEKIDIRFPTRFKRKSKRIKDISYWKETQVKTVTGLYREVEIRFDDKTQLTISYQEHTDYPKVVNYLKKKCARKKK